MIKSEFKKLFIKNKLIYLAVATAVLSLIFQLGSNAYPQFSFDDDQSFYEECMLQLYGKADDGKTEFVSNLYNDYTNAGKNLARLESDYSQGKINADDYEEEKLRLGKLSSSGNVAEYIVECASYVLENTERRYFIDYLSWTQVFQNYGFDFLLMIFVLVLSVSAVMIENNADMVTINSVSVKGRKYSGVSKIAVVVISTAVLTLILSAVHLIAFSGKYNLSGFNYPLESLKAYSGSTKNLSIIQAYLLLVLIKIFGYCSFAVWTMLFAVLIKKYVPAMTFSLALVLIPMYILNSATEGQIIYLLPLPVGAMMSTGYISGTQKSDYTEDYFFREVSYSQLAAVFLVLFIIALAMAFFVSNRLSGKRFSLKFHRKAAVAVMLVCVMLSLCSCSLGYRFEEADENYIVDRDMNTVYSESDGEFIPVDDIPKDSPSQVGFISGKNAVVKSGNTISLVDLETLERKELLQIGKNYDMSGFLGLEDLFPSIIGMAIDVNYENFSNLAGGKDNKLYFDSLNGITEYDITTGKSKRVNQIE